MTTTRKIVKTKPCTVKGCPGRTEELPNFPLKFCGACAPSNDNTMLLGCCGARVWQELANGELRHGFICDVCAAKQSQEYTTAYGNVVAAVMPSTKAAVAALTGPIANDGRVHVEAGKLTFCGLSIWSGVFLVSRTAILTRSNACDDCLRGASLVAVDAPKVVNAKHPELQPGEMFLTNTTTKRFESVGWMTKRLGLVAYGVDGCCLHESNNLFPCFAMRSELPKRFGGDAPDEKPVEEKPVPSIQPYDGMRVSVNGRKATVRPNISYGSVHPSHPWIVVPDDGKSAGVKVNLAWFDAQVIVEPITVHLGVDELTACGLKVVASNGDPAVWAANRFSFENLATIPSLSRGERCPDCVKAIEPKPNDYQKDRRLNFQHGKDCPVRQRQDFMGALTREQRLFLKPAAGRWKARCNCHRRRVEWIPTGTKGLRIAFNGDHVVPAPFNPKKDPEIPLSDLDEDFQG